MFLIRSKMVASLPGLRKLDPASTTGLHKGGSKLAEIICNFCLTHSVEIEFNGGKYQI